MRTSGALSRSRRRGNTIVEFTLVGIPMIFVLISTFEMARGMWLYDTLANAIKEGARYAIVSGKKCSEIPGCSATATVGEIAQHIRSAGVGIDPNEPEFSVTLTAFRLDPTAGKKIYGTPVTCTPLSSCLASAVHWPPSPGNMPNGDSVEITGVYPFRSAIAMFWPGAGGMVFGKTFLRVSSMEGIQF